MNQKLKVAAKADIQYNDKSVIDRLRNLHSTIPAIRSKHKLFCSDNGWLADRYKKLTTLFCGLKWISFFDASSGTKETKHYILGEKAISIYYSWYDNT